MAQTIDPELLAILVCPESHAPLVLVDDWLYSTDRSTRRRYPVREGIPIMLVDESEVIDFGSQGFLPGMKDGGYFAEILPGDNHAEIDVGAVQVKEHFKELIGIFIVFPAMIPKYGRGVTRVFRQIKLE